MKRLLFIYNVDWAFLTHRLPIASEAVKQGFEVHIATQVTDKLEVIENYGFAVHPLKLHRSDTGIISIFSEFREILSVIRLVSPDIVHLVTIKPVLLGGIAARLAGVPAIVSAVPGLGFVFVSKGFIALLRRKVISLLYRLAFGHKNQRIIFQNSDDQSQLTELARLSPKKSVLIHGSGVDLSLYSRKSICMDTPVVLLASRLLVSKGVREFVRAAELINTHGFNARFILVGEPDLMSTETIHQQELDLWEQQGIVELWGYRNDMNVVLSSANIVVLPSYYGEGLPKVLIEAAACGRAVITTDHPGCRDAIKDGVTGLLVPVRNVEALVTTISSLLNDLVRCEEMGRAGRKWAEEMFDVRQVVSEHMCIYEDLLEKVSS